ncbi:MAG: response regulator [Thermodesulfovibrionales bacterium]|nr:response regulator [Nitrospinota bacterium]MCG2710560.1 response regulator [Thermodesulfovibrionales bacterium]
MARKMLLADDSITIQKVVELVLAEEGFEIKAVNNGEEALAAIETFKPDVVLADIEMPKMNGYQLCEKLKAHPVTKNVPVILLSGAFEPLDEELARHVKADSFVIKPFESQELISKINAALVSASTIAETAEAVEAVEAEVVAEAVGAEEDLWAMEAVEGVAVETPSGIEEVSAEEEVSIAQALEAAEIQVRKEMPEVQIPSKEELISLFKKAVDERVASALSAIDIKNVMIESLTPVLKDSVEKILWEMAPELTDKLVKEVLQSSLASLSKEIEKIMWETVPDIAETLIAKEIEKIKSEM